MQLLKVLIILTAVFQIIGCASYEVLSDQMQPDGSYRIIAEGNDGAEIKNVREIAATRADGLCPLGYDIKSNIKLPAGLAKKIQLIIKCKESK